MVLDKFRAIEQNEVGSVTDKLRTTINALSKIQNDPQYHQSLISDIESITERNLICYIANLNHPAGIMVPDDDQFLEIVLRGVDLNKFDNKLDFMICSNGGLPEVADMLCQTLKTYSQDLRVIVPKAAMSAATLLAFGADKLALGEASQLGPIDPQMVIDDKKMMPANTIIKAYDELLKELDNTNRQSPKVAGLIQQLNAIDPLLVQNSKKAREVAKKLSKTMLSDGLLKGKDSQEIENKANLFIDHGDKLMHGAAIRYKKLKEWGFENIDLIDKESKLWQLLWDLFIRCERFVNMHNLTKYITNRHNGVQTVLAPPKR